MKHILTFLIIISVLFSDETLNIEDDFLQSLDEVSEIASKSKLNIDDTPSFVTVLSAKKLQKLGVTNVFEALGLVPGVQLKRELSGVPIVSFRGVMQKGEVKLMMDGVTINNAYRGSIYYYLDFPIELIQRIEVIRGAGSVLYGSGAISGVVNIITKSSQKDVVNAIFTSAGTYNDYLIGTVLSTKLDDVKLSLDAYYHSNDKMIENDQHLKDYSLGLNISDERFALLARVKKSDIGNAYGLFGQYDTTRDAYYNENLSYLAQVSYKNSLSRNNKLSILAGYNKYGQNIEALHSALGTISSNYEEESYFSQLDVISQSLNDNELLIGARFESDKTLKATLYTPSSPNSSRDTISIYLNDKYSLTQKLDITAGLRYDDYSDFGDSFSPTLGIVYRATDRVRLKALYSHAYRAPSWIELTVNPDFKAETSDSVEAGIIFKQNHHNTLRINSYMIQIKDLITQPERAYVQNSENNFYGTELEYIYIPNNQIEFNVFASYIKAEDKDGTALANVANTLASTSLTYESKAGITFGSLLKYVSCSKRESTDAIRDDMPSGVIFNETVSYAYKAFSANLIIKDLFDKGTYYALPLKSNANLTDFDEEGRSILLKVSMAF